MEPAWLSIAYQELRKGVREVEGAAHNPRIIQYHTQTTFQATSDEVAWCSAFACFCMEQARVAHPRSARARDWLRWGVGVSVVHPPIGAVVVLKRGGPGQPGPEVLEAPGHVGLFWGHGAPGEIILLGGNQGNAVSLDKFSVHHILGVRWPS